MARSTYYLFEADGYQDVVVRVPSGHNMDAILEEAVNAECFGRFYGVLHEYDTGTYRALFEGLMIHQVPRGEAESYGIRGTGMDLADYLTTMANTAGTSYTPYDPELAHTMKVYCADRNPACPIEFKKLKMNSMYGRCVK